MVLSKKFSFWKNISDPIYMEVYLFADEDINRPILVYTSGKWTVGHGSSQRPDSDSTITLKKFRMQTSTMQVWQWNKLSRRIVFKMSEGHFFSFADECDHGKALKKLKWAVQVSVDQKIISPCFQRCVRSATIRARQGTVRKKRCVPTWPQYF